MKITHPIPPVYDSNSRILILGSFPSVRSREEKFFYGHPQNRFWKVTAAIFGEETPTTTDEKRAFLLRNRIAVWDVLASCEIKGSADNTICNATPNDLTKILSEANIEQIYLNGKTAYLYYQKYFEKEIGREAILLPSTSPANAAWTLEKLIKEWAQIKGETE